MSELHLNLISEDERALILKALVDNAKFSGFGTNNYSVYQLVHELQITTVNNIATSLAKLVKASSSEEDFLASLNDQSQTAANAKNVEMLNIVQAVIKLRKFSKDYNEQKENAAAVSAAAAREKFKLLAKAKGKAEEDRIGKLTPEEIDAEMAALKDKI